MLSFGTFDASPNLKLKLPLPYAFGTASNIGLKYSSLKILISRASHLDHIITEPSGTRFKESTFGAAAYYMMKMEANAYLLLFNQSTSFSIAIDWSRFKIAQWSRLDANHLEF